MRSPHPAAESVGMGGGQPAESKMHHDGPKRAIDGAMREAPL